jgi:hypothetical protein
MEISSKAKVGRVVPSAASYTSQRGSEYAPGISEETVWAPRSHRRCQKFCVLRSV